MGFLTCIIGNDSSGANTFAKTLYEDDVEFLPYLPYMP